MLFKIVFFAGVFLLPFVVWVYSPTPFEVPRVWLFQRWVELLAVLGVFSLKQIKNKPNFLLLCLGIIFLAVSVWSSWQGVDWPKSIKGNYYRADGLITLFHFIVFVFVTALFWRNNWKKLLSLIVFSSALLVSLWALDESVNINFLGNLSLPDFAGAVGASFGQPNFLAGYLLIALPFGLFSYLQAERKLVKFLLRMGLVLQALAIFLTMSWGGILGLVLLILLYFLFLQIRLALKISFAMILFLVLLGSLFYYSQTRPKFVVGHRLAEVHPQSRVRIVNNALYAFTQKPLFGWGWANFDYAFEGNPQDVRYGYDVYVDKAHSILLEVLTTSGIVGFLSYLSVFATLLMLLFLRMKRETNVFWHRTLFIALVLYFFHSQTNVISVNEEFFFWLITGIMAGSKR